MVIQNGAVPGRLVLGLLLVIVSLAAACVQGKPASLSTTTTHAREPVVLFGNGIASARFGATEPGTKSRLVRMLGAPSASDVLANPGNCGINDSVRWTTVTTYFARGYFVGYEVVSPVGRASPTPIAVTAQGLRVGDTLSRAQAAYGSALTTSAAQGGDWSASTPEGKLIGNLSAELNQTVPPLRVTSISAGAVGCAAASP